MLCYTTALDPILIKPFLAENKDSFFFNKSIWQKLLIWYNFKDYN